MKATQTKDMRIKYNIGACQQPTTEVGKKKLLYILLLLSFIGIMPLLEGCATMTKGLIVEADCRVNRHNGQPTPAYWKCVRDHPLNEEAKENARISNKEKALQNEVEQSNTALHKAAGSNDVKLAKKLIAEGADVDAKNKGHETPLYIAAHKGHVAVAELLISKGADVNKHGGYMIYDGSMNLFDFSLIKRAIFSGHESMVELLLSKGVDINGKNSFSRDDTPLSDAIYVGNYSMTKLLVSKGADVNAKNRDGKTPLYAVEVLKKDKDPLKFVTFLVSNGADVNAKSDLGHTTLSQAIKYNNKQGRLNALIDLLKKHGAKE